MNNLKISKNLKIIVVAGVIITISSIGINKAYFSGDKIDYKYNGKANDFRGTTSEEFESAKENLEYVDKNNLVLFDSVKDEIVNNKVFIEKKVVTDVTAVDDRVKFKVDNVLLTNEEKKDFMGLVDYSDKVNFILYKVNDNNGEYSLERVVTDDMNIEGVYYVDPDDYIELVDPQEGYFINGKIRKKE